MQRRLFRVRVVLAVSAVFYAVSDLAYGQESAGPKPVPLPPAIATPVDKPYGGPIALSVDLTNVNDRIVNVRETIPVKSEKMTLLYPQWLPGTHSPSNAVANLAGLVITADGRRIPWTRDSVNMWAFHIEVPKDATSLDLSFQFWLQ